MDNKKWCILIIAAAVLLCMTDPVPAYNFRWDSGHQTGETGDRPNPTPGDGSDDDDRGSGGDDVDFATGDFAYWTTDIDIPARGPDLNLTRTYHSQEEYIGPFGRGWHCNWDVKVVMTSDGEHQQITLFNLGDQLGVRKTFTQDVGGEWIAPPGYHATVEVNPDDSVTVTTKHGTVFQFAPVTSEGLMPPAGFLTSVTDHNGNSATVAYNASGRLATVTGSTGRALNFSYGADGHVVQITDPAGRTFNYAYDSQHNLVTYTDAGGNHESYVHDTDNRLVSMADAKDTTWLANTYDSEDRVTDQFFNGSYFHFSYGGTEEAPECSFTERDGTPTDYQMDTNGLVTGKTVDPSGLRLIHEYAYDADLNLVSYTDPLGNTTTHIYDSDGNNTLTTDALGNTTARSFDPAINRLADTTDAVGNTTTYDRDANGNLTKVTDPLGREISFTYDTNGDLLTMTDAAGNITQVEHESHGKISKLTDALGGETPYVYDTLGNQTSTTDANGQTITYTYDSSDNLTTITDPLGNITSFEYDANANRTAMTDAGGGRTEYAFDMFDNLTAITDPTGNEIQYGYDAAQRLVSISDPLSSTTTKTYDAAGRLTGRTDSLGASTEFEYDKNGNMTKLIEPSGNETVYTYDAINQVTKVTYPDTTFDSYTYDAVGNIADKTFRNGDTVTYVYDAVNRLDSKVYPDTSTTEYVYHVQSGLASITTADSTVSYVYDTLNRVVSVTQNGKTVGYEYDAVGNRTKITYPDGSFVTRSFDAGDQLAQITDQDSEIVGSFTYNSVNRRIQLDRGNGTRTTYSYDAARKLTNIANTVIDPESAISSFAYGHDGDGKRTTLTTDAGTHAYTFDDTDRVTAVDYPDGSPFADTTFTYDTVGNRTATADGGSTTYTVNSLNQYTDIAGTARSHDANGNLTSDGTNTYTFGYENRLISASTPSASSITYKYDGFGRRIEKNVDGAVTKYVYSGNRIVAEYDGTDTLLATYVHGTRTDEVIRMTRGASDYYFCTDALGTVTNVTDATAAVVDSYSYSVFGETGGTSAVGNPFMFTGREHDSETGLLYLRNRYYSASTGRFLSPDPIGFWGGVNLYTYCFNDPVDMTDPFGLKIKWDDPEVLDALEDLYKNSDTAREILEELENADEVIKIELTEGGNSYSPPTNTVKFNPDKTHAHDQSEHWHDRPPEVGLGHELIHAQHDVNGTLADTRMAEENQTIGIGDHSDDSHTENQIRDDYGLPRRPEY